MDFFIEYFALILLSLVMIGNAAIHFSTNKRINLYSIAITLCCLILAACSYIQKITKPLGYYYLVLTLSIIGYCLRPTCMCLFIFMNKKAYRGKWSFLIWIPLVINAIVYLCAYIPGTEDIIFGFRVVDDGSLTFAGGPLRYTSHIISILYLIYLLYISIFTLKSKYFLHGIAILSCALFVTTATVIETFFNDNGDIDVLNITVMVSTIAYYLFLYKENMQIDPLTGLYNRDTYYRDLNKMQKTFVGIIHFDINGLKYINDNYGHQEGDNCISLVAHLIGKSIKKNMYAYRIGGDEFLVIVNKSNEEDILNTISLFKELLEQCQYSCSVGYATKKDNESIDDVIRAAEKNMYLDKEEFYKNSPFERRRT